MTKPGCVQHDCDKCKEVEQLLSFIGGRMEELFSILQNGDYSQREKITRVMCAVQTCRAQIANHKQQS